MSRETTRRLMAEHRQIERVVAALYQAADKLEAGKAVEQEFWLKAVDFIRNFADDFHHAKEEKLLFAAYKRRGLPEDDGPVAQMLIEHDMGRKHVKIMAEIAQMLAQGQAKVEAELGAAAVGFADLLSQHIWKENNILYPMGENVLSEADEADLLAEFNQADNGRGGQATFDKYEDMAARLEELAGLIQSTSTAAKLTG